MKGFILVHDKAWGNRVTLIKKKAITSIAHTLADNAEIAYGNDLVVETGESFESVIRLFNKEV